MLIKLLIVMAFISGPNQVKNEDLKRQSLTKDQIHLYEGCFQHMFEKIYKCHTVSDDLLRTMEFLERELYKQFKKDNKDSK